jgi:hypothetical protein
MADNKTYLQFVKEVKQQILQSRYQAAKLVNKELLLLYYHVGKMLHEKIKQAKWGDKVLQTISADLQKELPDLKDFHFVILKTCGNFSKLMPHFRLGRTVTAKLEPVTIRQTASARLQP